MNLVYNGQSLCIRRFGYSIIARVAIGGGSVIVQFCFLRYLFICLFACVFVCL